MFMLTREFEVDFELTTTVIFDYRFQLEEFLETWSHGIPWNDTGFKLRTRYCLQLLFNIRRIKNSVFRVSDEKKRFLNIFG